MRDIIEINNLSFGYNSSQKTLNNINLKIKEKDFTCIIGENGSGKTTLIKCILGLNKNYTGNIEIKEKLGYLPQITDIQNNFPATIEEVILSGTIPNNMSKIFYTKEDKKVAEEVMKELNIYDIRKKCFRELSGGQKQRVLIGRAMCTKCKILILDEPANGLDPEIVHQIYEILCKLNKEKDLTILMISHDIDRIFEYCRRVIEIRHGEVEYDGEPSKFERRKGGTKKC